MEEEELQEAAQTTVQDLEGNDTPPEASPKLTAEVSRGFIRYIKGYLEDQGQEITTGAVSRVYKNNINDPGSFIAGILKEKEGDTPSIYMVESIARELGVKIPNKYTVKGITFADPDVDNLVDQHRKIKSEEEASPIKRDSEEADIANEVARKKTELATQSRNPFVTLGSQDENIEKGVRSRRENLNKKQDEHAAIVRGANLPVISVADAYYKTKEKLENQKRNLVTDNDSKEIYFQSKNYLEDYSDMMNMQLQYSAEQLNGKEREVANKILQAKTNEDVTNSGIADLDGFSDGMERFMEQLRNSSEQSKEIRKGFSVTSGFGTKGVEEGDRVDEAVGAAQQDIQADRDEDQSLFNISDIPSLLNPIQNLMPSQKPSVVGTVRNSLKQSYLDFWESLPSLVSGDPNKELLEAANKEPGFGPAKKRLFNQLSNQDFLKQVKKLEETTVRSDYSAPLWEKTVNIDGHVVAVDDSGEFTRIIRPDGKTAVNMTDEEKAAVDKYNINKGSYTPELSIGASQVKSAAYNTFNTVVQMAPMLAAGAATGGAGLVGTLFVQTYGTAYQEELARSGDAGKAALYGSITAGIESGGTLIGGFEKGVINAARGTAFKNAGKRAAEDAIKSPLEFNFNKSLFKGIKKEIVGEEAEEISVLYSQAMANSLFGAESNVTINDFVTTLVTTPLATAPIAAVSNYNTLKNEYGKMVVQAAHNYERFSETLGQMIADGQITEEEAIKKAEMVVQAKNRLNYISEKQKETNVNLTKSQQAELEDIVYRETSQTVRGKDVKGLFDKRVDAIFANAEVVKENVVDTSQSRAEEDIKAPPIPPKVTANDLRAQAAKENLIDEDPEEVIDNPDEPLRPMTNTDKVLTDYIKEEKAAEGKVQVIDVDGEGNPTTQDVTYDAGKEIRKLEYLAEIGELTEDDITNSRLFQGASPEQSAAIIENFNNTTSQKFVNKLRDIYDFGQIADTNARTVVPPVDENLQDEEIRKRKKFTRIPDDSVYNAFDLDNQDLKGDKEVEVLTTDGQPAILRLTEGGRLEVEQNNTIRELGNINDQVDVSLSELGVSPVTAINITSDGSFNINGEKYTAPDIVDAITYDDQGNVTSVVLQKSTLTGEYGNDAAINTEEVEFTGKEANDIAFLIQKDLLNNDPNIQSDLEQLEQSEQLITKAEQAITREADANSPQVDGVQKAEQGVVSGFTEGGKARTIRGIRSSGQPNTRRGTEQQTPTRSTRPEDRNNESGGKPEFYTSNGGKNYRWDVDAGRYRRYNPSTGRNGAILSAAESRRIENEVEAKRVDNTNLSKKKSVIFNTTSIDISEEIDDVSLEVDAATIKNWKKNHPELYAQVEPYIPFILRGSIKVNVYSNNGDYVSEVANVLQGKEKAPEGQNALFSRNPQGLSVIAKLDAKDITGDDSITSISLTDNVAGSSGQIVLVGTQDALNLSNNNINAENVFVPFEETGVIEFSGNPIERITKHFINAAKNAAGSVGVFENDNSQFTSVRDIAVNKSESSNPKYVGTLLEDAKGSMMNIVNQGKQLYLRQNSDATNAVLNSINEYFRTGDEGALVDPELKELVDNFVSQVRDYPEGVSQTNLNHPVSVGAFGVAIVPEGTDVEVENRLRAQGVRIVRSSVDAEPFMSLAGNVDYTNDPVTVVGNEVFVDGSNISSVDLKAGMLRAFNNSSKDIFVAGLFTELKKSPYIIENYPEFEIEEELQDDQDFEEYGREDIPDDGTTGQASEAVIGSYTNARKVEGKSRPIILPSGERLNAKYVLVDASNIFASHDENTFGQTEGFPTNEDGTTVNSRNYESNEDAKAAVVTFASRFDERALDEPIVVTGDGIVISGNNRTMSRKLAATNGTDGLYVSALPDYSEGLGFNKKEFDAAMEAFDTPVLVRELTDEAAYTKAQFHKFNASAIKSESIEEKSQRIKSQLSAKIISSIAQSVSEYDVLSEYYAVTSNVNEFKKILLKSEIINNNEAPLYFATEGKSTRLTDLGKDLLKVTIMSATIDNDLLSLARKDGLKSVFNAISYAGADLLVNSGLKGFSIIDDINGAIRLLNDYTNGSKGLSGIAGLVNQLSLFSGSGYTTNSILAAYYITRGERAFKDYVKSFNKSAEDNSGADMFGQSLGKADILTGKTNLFVDSLDPSKDAADINVLKTLIEKGFSNDNDIFYSLNDSINQVAVDIALGEINENIDAEIMENGINPVQYNSAVNTLKSGIDKRLTDIFKGAMRRALSSLGVENPSDFIRNTNTNVYRAYVSLVSGNLLPNSTKKNEILDNISDLLEGGLLKADITKVWDAYAADFLNNDISFGDLSNRYSQAGVENITDSNYTLDAIEQMDLPDAVANPYQYYLSMNVDGNVARLAADYYDLFPSEFNKTKGALMLANAVAFPESGKFDAMELYPFTREEMRDIQKNYGITSPDSIVNAYYMHVLNRKPNDGFAGVDEFMRDVLELAVSNNVPLASQYKKLVSELNVQDPDALLNVGDVYELREIGYEGIFTVDGIEYDNGVRNYILKAADGTVISMSDTDLDSVNVEEVSVSVGTDIQDAISKAKIVLSKVSPGTKFVVSNTIGLHSKYGVNVKGVYDPITDTIYINSEVSTSKDVVHEAVHAIAVKTFLSSSDRIVELHNIISSVLNNGNAFEKDLALKVETFVSQYTKAQGNRPLDIVRANEFFAELVGLLSTVSGRISKPKTQQIIDGIKAWFNELIGRDVDIEVDTINDLINVVNGIADSFSKGEVFRIEDYRGGADLFNRQTQPFFARFNRNRHFKVGDKVTIWIKNFQGEREYASGNVRHIYQVDGGRYVVRIGNTSFFADILRKDANGKFYIKQFEGSLRDRGLLKEQQDYLNERVDRFKDEATFDVFYEAFKPEFDRRGIKEEFVRQAYTRESAKSSIQRSADFVSDPEVNRTMRRLFTKLGPELRDAQLDDLNDIQSYRRTTEELFAAVDSMLVGIGNDQASLSNFVNELKAFRRGDFDLRDLDIYVLTLDHLLNKQLALSAAPFGVEVDGIQEEINITRAEITQVTSAFPAIGHAARNLESATMGKEFINISNRMSGVDFKEAEKVTMDKDGMTLAEFSKFISGEVAKNADSETKDLLSNQEIINAASRLNNLSQDQRELVDRMLKLFGEKRTSRTDTNIDNNPFFSKLNIKNKEEVKGTIGVIFEDPQISADAALDAVKNFLLELDYIDDIGAFFKDNLDIVKYIDNQYANKVVAEFTTRLGKIDSTLRNTLRNEFKKLHTGKFLKSALPEDFIISNDSVKALTDLFLNRENALQVLQKSLSNIEAHLNAQTTSEGLAKYREQFSQVKSLIDALSLDQNFVNASRSKIMSAITYGISKLSPEQLKAAGIDIPYGTKPQNYSNIAMGAIMRKSVKQGNLSVRMLTDSLIRDMDLSVADATALAEVLNGTYHKVIGEKRIKLVNRLLKSSVRSNRQRATIEERMRDIIRIGDMTDAGIVARFAEKFGLRELTEEEVERAADLTKIIEEDVNPRNREAASRELHTIMREAKESKQQRYMKILTGVRFINLLSGQNTVLKAVAASGILVLVEAAFVALPQLALRGQIGNFLKYQKNNKELFRATATKLFFDAFKRGAPGVSYEEIPDQGYSSIDVILNHGMDLIFGQRGPDAKTRKELISNHLQKFSGKTKLGKAESILNGLFGTAIFLPGIMVRSLQAIDVFLNTFAVEPLTFIEAHDQVMKKYDYDFKRGNAEFFNEMETALGVGGEYTKDLNDKINAIIKEDPNLSKGELATIKKSLVLENREKAYQASVDKLGKDNVAARSVRKEAHDRALTTSVLNSQVNGLFSGGIAYALTATTRGANKGSTVAAIADQLLRITFAPIVRTVGNGIYLGYNWSPLALIQAGLTEFTNIDRLSFDISSGKVLINNVSLEDLKRVPGFSFSSLWRKNDEAGLLIKDNRKSKADRESFRIRAGVGTGMALGLIAMAFDWEEDEDGNLKPVKNKYWWDMVSITSEGYRDYTTNRNRLGNDFRENTISIGGFHLNWTETPLSAPLGMIGVIGDKIDTGQEVSPGIVAQTFAMGALKHIYGEGFEIGIDAAIDMVDSYTAIKQADGNILRAENDNEKRRYQNDKEFAKNRLASKMGGLLNAQTFSSFYRQGFTQYKEFAGTPRQNLYGEDFNETFMNAFLRNVPLFEKDDDSRHDILGNEIPTTFDTYFFPDAFADRMGQYMNEAEKNPAYKIIHGKDIDSYELYKYRSQAQLKVNTSDYYLETAAKRDAQKIWSDIFNEYVSEDIKSLERIKDPEERQEEVFRLARKVKNDSRYLDFLRANRVAKKKK
jgi:hypothetical protein